MKGSSIKNLKIKEMRVFQNIPLTQKLDMYSQSKILNNFASIVYTILFYKNLLCQLNSYLIYTVQMNSLNIPLSIWNLMRYLPPIVYLFSNSYLWDSDDIEPASHYKLLDVFQ